MTAQFAGSRSLDDRRRRRLAQELESEPTSQAKNSRKRSSASEKSEESSVEDWTRTDVVADESIIPRALWKVWLYGCVGILAWTLLIWINLRLPLNFELHRVFSVQDGRAFRLLNTISLIVTSQLCFIIWWYRSRSRKDFGGRYRIWAWAGGFWTFTCIVSGLQLHRPLANFAYETWPIHTWKPELLYWFVPFSIGVLALHQLISLEMRHSRASRVLWNSAFFCGCLASATLFAGSLIFDASELLVINAGLLSIWHFLNSLTLLFHARFVVHVTNEAAPRHDLWYSRLKVKLYALYSRSYAFCRNILSRVSIPSKKKDQKSVSKFQQRRALRIARKEEKRLKREAAKADQIAAKELAIEEKKAAQELKAQAKLDAKNAREEKKQADELKRKTARENKKKDKEVRQPTQVVKKTQNVEEQKPAKPEKTLNLEETAPRTKSGRKRKRVLGNKQRIDQPESVNSPHVEDAPQSTKRKNRNFNQDESYDDYEEDEQDFRQMSKKQKRRARKKQRH